MNNAEIMDREVMAQMLQAGSDLTKPHPIYYYLYFRAKAAAEAAGAILRQEGFGVKIHPAPNPWWKRFFVKYRWTCLAEKTFIPEEATVIAASQRMNALAAQHQGDFDGWEAQIVR